MKHLLLACIMAVICLPVSGGNNKKSRPGGASLKVLCLGNSITRHEYKADIEWFSEWGMAASKEENDYCHQLQKLLCAEHPGTVVTPLNIAYWERNLACDIDSLIGSAVRGKDLVVIRLGENVQDKQAFLRAFSAWWNIANRKRAGWSSPVAFGKMPRRSVPLFMPPVPTAFPLFRLTG